MFTKLKKQKELWLIDIYEKQTKHWFREHDITVGNCDKSEFEIKFDDRC